MALELRSSGGVDGYWRRCFSVDVRAVHLQRICLGLLVAADMLGRLADTEAHYSDQGILPREAVMNMATRGGGWSLQFISGEVWFSWAVLALTAVCGVAAAIKYRSKGVLIVLWLLVWSVQNRNPLVNNGGDVLLRLLLFWQIWIPASAGCRRTVFGAGTVGLLLQVCLVYWFSALWKSAPEWRVHHTALAQALSLESFQGPLASALIAHPGLMQLLTFSALLLEQMGPFAVFFPPDTMSRVRTVCCCAFVLFHLVGISACFRLGLFPFVCAAAWIPFLPAAALQYLWPWPRVPHPDVQGQENFSVSRLPAGHMLGNALLPAFFIAVAVWANVSFLVRPSGGFQWLERVPACLGLHQSWQLFAPKPTNIEGTMRVLARLENGDTVELVKLAASQPEDASINLADEFANIRWREAVQWMLRWHRYEHLDSVLRYYVMVHGRSSPARIQSADLYSITFQVDVNRKVVERKMLAHWSGQQASAGNGSAPQKLLAKWNPDMALLAE